MAKNERSKDQKSNRSKHLEKMSLCSYMEKDSKAYSTMIQTFQETHLNGSVSAAVVIQDLLNGNRKIGVGDGKED